MELTTILSRNKEHELAAKCLYSALIYMDLNEEIDIQAIISGIFKEKLLEMGIKEVDDKEDFTFEELPLYTREVVIKSLMNLEAIIATYQAHMPKWNFSRLNAFERAIMIMSYTSSKIMKETDKGVIIDVAVTLAKNYLDKDDYKFVNAILDNVL